MSESPEKPTEQKPSHNQQAVDDLLWEIPFARPVWNFFIREGKAVKNGWVAVAMMVGISVWITHSKTEGDIDAKLSGLTNYFNGEISNLKGQLSDARQERDKYQLMLVPFEAFAIAKYTNAPIDERLTMLGATMNLITNQLASDKPIIHLEINGTKIVSYESPKLGTMLPLTDILLSTNRQISMQIINDSEITAEHVSVNFLAYIDPTNILADQWGLEPKCSDGRNHWHLVATDSYGSLQTWYPQTIVISQNFKQGFCVVEFLIHADRSKTWVYVINFTLQN